MPIEVQLRDLHIFHPNLLWDEIAGAASAVIFADKNPHAVDFELNVENVPNFGTDRLQLKIERSQELIARAGRLRKTYDGPRLVELAGIAIAGVGLYYAGGHEIRDVAVHGSAADYLVDEECHVLEVAGRSRQKDSTSAWNARWKRLSDRSENGFYLCVVEFETFSGRLAFRD